MCFLKRYVIKDGVFIFYESIIEDLINNNFAILADYGGELALYLPDDDGGEVCKLIQPLAGRLVVFESKLLEHEVKQVKHPRYSITGWLKTR